MKKILSFAVAVLATMTMSAQSAQPIVMACDSAYDAAFTLQPGDTLQVDNVTAIVEVTGFVTNGGNGSVSSGKQTFYIGKSADETAKTLQVYKGEMGEQAAVNKGDKVKITGKLMHYRNASGSTDVAELINSTVEVLSRVEVKIDTISDLSVCEIIEEGESLNGGAYSSDFFEITAVVDSLTYTSGMKQTFFFKCVDEGATKGKTLQAYNANMQDSILADEGDTVRVLGKITLYAAKNQVEFEGPNAWVVGKVAREPMDTLQVTVAQALAIGQALEKGAKTDAVYAIVGYVDSITDAYSEQYKNTSFYMTDDMSQPTFDFLAYRIPCTEDVPVGTKVIVTGKIQHYYKAAEGEEPEKDLIETMQGATMEIIAEDAVENIVNDAVVTKRIENGQLIIYRNGARFTVTGVNVQ